LLTTTALFPEIVRENPRLYATVMVLSLGMLVYFWKNPLDLPFTSFSTHESKPPAEPGKTGPTTEEVDAVQDKVSRMGIQNLTKKEQAILENASKK
jgi:hypothetical protein